MEIRVYANKIGSKKLELKIDWAVKASKTQNPASMSSIEKLNPKGIS